MKLIVGLGNPGRKYENNRHNIGFMVIDRLASEFGTTNYELSEEGQTQYAWLKIGREKAEILKPQTFMNNSGFSVGYAKKNHSNLRNSDICIIHDDLDIPLGSYKMQFGKGPRLHNGVNSIEEGLGTKNFWRLRVGINNREGNRGESEKSGEEYVLSNFSGQEREILEGTIGERIVPVIKDWLLKRSAI